MKCLVSKMAGCKIPWHGVCQRDVENVVFCRVDDGLLRFRRPRAVLAPGPGLGRARDRGSFFPGGSRCPRGFRARMGRRKEVFSCQVVGLVLL